ncbi:orotidine 5'-phosphate decarboxylase [Yoonia sp. MH D7]
MFINDLRYNAQSGVFQASVELRRDGHLFRYPCELRGPQSLDAATIAAGLAKHALHMSDAARA